LKLLLVHDDLVPWAALHLDLNWVQHPSVKVIISQRLSAVANQTWTTLAAFLNECSQPELQNLISEVTIENRALPNPAQQLSDVVMRLRNQFIDRQLTGLTQRLTLPETTEVGRVELLREQQALRSMKRQPLTAK
jgi:hypothetical protein